MNQITAIRMQRNRLRSGTRPSIISVTQKTNGMLIKLVVCIIVFLTVFIGRGFFPYEVGTIRENLLKIIENDIDFRGKLTELGKSMSGSHDVIGNFSTFYSEVFGSEVISAVQADDGSRENIGPERLPIGEEKGCHTDITELENLENKEIAGATQPQTLLFSEDNSVTEKSVPSVGTVLVKADYTGPDLSERDTMDQLSLGNIKTTSPILGHRTSQYGWRTHPISGKQHFHGGVDISGKMGAAIGAFADGTVEYIGRDKSYGIYMQIDHGQGVKSFYAHCSRLCVTKGQKVKIGEKVAEVGSTGCSTGPHLHLELKCGKKRLNPSYYIDFLDS